MKKITFTKKTVLLAALILLASIGVAIGISVIGENPVVYAAEKEDRNDEEPITVKVKLSEDEAVAIAAESVDANAKVIYVELEDENGTIVYSVEMTQNGKKFEVNVDANSGKIIKSGEDVEYEGADEEDNEDGDEPVNVSVKLTQSEAVAIAAASVDSGAKILNVELEDENGVIVYGVEMTLNGKELDIKVDANSGQIVASDDNAEYEDEVDEDD